MSLVNKFIPGNEINNSLYKAIYSGDLEKVSYIIDSVGLSYCASWAEGYDLVVTAITCKHVDIAKLLVKKNCRLNVMQTSMSNTKTILELAVELGNVEFLGILLDKDTAFCTRSQKGDSLLHVAIAEGKDDIVKYLLERGDDVECKNAVGMASLHLAAVRGRPMILEQILSFGANIESQDLNGKTSLFLAVSSGHKDLVKILLERGANCNCAVRNNQTPLLDATFKGYFEIVKDLLEFGADINAKNNFGQTALHVACFRKHKKLISLLLDAGADINAVDSVGTVPSDAIVKIVSPFSTFFEDSAISYILGKHFTILKVGGLFLNKRNQNFYDIFYGMYCNDIVVGNMVLSSTSDMLLSTLNNCHEEISLMKKTKSDGGFSAYDIFKKIKDPLSVTSENEIQFLESINMKINFPLYESFFRNHLKIAKLRNNLLASAQEWIGIIMHVSRNKLQALPEEMRLQVVSFLNNSELEQLILCGKKIADT